MIKAGSNSSENDSLEPKKELSSGMFKAHQYTELESKDAPGKNQIAESIMEEESVNENKHEDQPQAETKPVEITFPDFYEIDYIDYTSRKKNLELIESDFHFTQKESHSNCLEFIDGNLSVEPLLSFMKQQQDVLSLKNINDFLIKRLLYQHRDEIFFGTIFPQNKDKETMAFIKRFSLRNALELNFILREMAIHFELYRKTESEPQSCYKTVNTLLAYYYDYEKKYFYTFYEHYSKSFLLEIQTIDLKASSPNKMKTKLIFLLSLLKFLYVMHSNGIIHRDFCLEYFNYDSLNLCPKIFDFANAYKINESLSPSQILNELRTEVYFLTPKYVSPEVSSANPLFGFGQDMWAFGCVMIELFLDYSVISEEGTNKYLNRIFQGYQEDCDFKEKYPIPKIPKLIEKEIALILIKCFEIDMNQRVTCEKLIQKVKSLSFFTQYSLSFFALNQLEMNQLLKMENISSQLIEIKIGLLDEEQKALNEKCPIHKKKKSIYCRNCNGFYCDDSFMKNHPSHDFYQIDKDAKNEADYLIDTKNELSFLKSKVEKMELENNSYIDNISIIFEKDYQMEKLKLIENYSTIRKKIKALHELQLKKLEESKQKFLDVKYNKIFSEGEVIRSLCKKFYQTKNLFLSNFNRFRMTFNNKEITKDSLFYFKKKYEQFCQLTDTFGENAQELKKKCENLHIPGKYIFRYELYTEEIQNSLKELEKKRATEKQIFFEFSKPDSLILSKEILMIIPLTTTVFSYVLNAYNKYKVNFQKNKIKTNTFLPGSATLLQGNHFFITGGEVKDEATSSFLYFSIGDKVIEEGIEMNFTRRFHSMMSLFTPNKSYICIIGGWDSKEVEMIETTNQLFDKWLILPSMHYSRSDPSTFQFNHKYIYVFGGWDYSTKKNLGEIERYEIFNEETIKLTKKWEIIKVKGDESLLKKYNMGLIALPINPPENLEAILLVGGYDETFDYSNEVVRVEILQKENYVVIRKNENCLPQRGECSFWYEKQFQNTTNDLDGSNIAINFNCFNHLYIYSFGTNTFTPYPNENN